MCLRRPYHRNHIDVEKHSQGRSARKEGYATSSSSAAKGKVASKAQAAAAAAAARQYVRKVAAAAEARQDVREAAASANNSARSAADSPADTTQLVQQTPSSGASATGAGPAEGESLSPATAPLWDPSRPLGTPWVPPVGLGIPVRKALSEVQSSGRPAELPRVALSDMRETLSQAPNLQENAMLEASPLGLTPRLDGISPQRSGGTQDPNAQANQYVESAQIKFNAAAHPYDYTSAIQDLDRAIILVPSYGKAHTLRATAYDAIGSYDKAMVDSLQALRQNPKNSAAWTDLALARLMRNDPAGAKEDADNSLAIVPDSAEAHWIRAQALEAMGQHDDAMADAVKAAALEPRKFKGRYEAARHGAKLFDPSEKDSSYLFQEVSAYTGGNHVSWPLATGIAILLVMGFGVARARSKNSRDSSLTAPVAANVDAEKYLAGKYQMMRIIGRGGMGEVYEALDRSLNRSVAIKKMSSGLASDVEKTVREFLLKEAKTVASLHHPGIVDIYEILERGSDIYLVFELVKGKTLEQILVEKGRLSVSQAVQILKPVCRALSFAHSQDVVHRDLKPSNIMVTRQGHVKVMDFGIARIVAERGTLTQARGLRVPVQDGRIAYTSTAVGTPIYMAPEMEEGIVCKTSDIYALGCCLYEILTGSPPFHMQIGIAEKLDMNFPPASSVVPGLPAAIDALVREALEPDREKRLKTAMEFLVKLEAAASSMAWSVPLTPALR